MSTEEIFSSLQKKLYTPSIFFIPKGDIPQLAKDIIESIVKKFPNYNEILFVENDGAPYLLKQKPKLFQIITKSSYLDKNIFDLLDYKEELKSDQFEHLLKKYLEQAEIYINIAIWLDDNLGKYMPNTDDTIKTYFSLQKDALIKHQTALRENFLFKKRLPTVDPTEAWRQFKKNMGLIELSNKEQNKELPTKNIKTTEKKPKPILITDEEADRFLLESVFRVRLD